MFAGGRGYRVARWGWDLRGDACHLHAKAQRRAGEASRPFDKLRDALLAEGAAAVLLEDLEFAQARGANILAEITGYGASADASHVTAPAEGGEGAARAMTMALRDAKLKPKDIDYMNAHGTGTPLNEKYETMAIKTAFGDHAYKCRVVHQEHDRHRWARRALWSLSSAKSHP